MPVNRQINSDPEICFRNIDDDDLPFLERLYASTREEELSVVPWSDDEKQRFLQMQFHAQHQHYKKHYSDAVFEIVLIDDQPAGRLYLQRRADEHRVVDIALLPEFRRRGIGRRIMNNILREAANAGKHVRIHVEQNNPAMSLYQRLGFKKVGDAGVYFLMEWNANSTPKSIS